MLGISPMPSSYRARRLFLEVLPESYEGYFYDLGSGWATVIAMVAKRYPTATIIGYEKSLIPFIFSYLRTCFRKNVRIYRRDFLELERFEKGVFFCYLYPGAMEKLAKRPPQGKLYSNAFHLPNHKPKCIYEVSGTFQRTEIFEYVLR